MRLRNADLIAVLLVICAARAHAQGTTADTAFQPLALPIGPPLRCRSVDSAHVTKLAFRLGEGPATPERGIEARFDSLGHALSLTDWYTGQGPQLGGRVVPIAR